MPIFNIYTRFYYLRQEAYIFAFVDLSVSRITQNTVDEF